MKHAKPPRRNLATRTHLKQPASLTPFMQWVYAVNVRLLEFSLVVWVCTGLTSFVITYLLGDVTSASLLPKAVMLDVVSNAALHFVGASALAVSACMDRLTEIDG